MSKKDKSTNSPLKENPSWVADHDIWEKAKKASIKSYGKISHPFTVYIYKQMGGRIKKKANSMKNKKLMDISDISVLVTVLITDINDDDFNFVYHYSPFIEKLESIEEDIKNYFDDIKIKKIEILSMAYSKQ